MNKTKGIMTRNKTEKIKQWRKYPVSLCSYTYWFKFKFKFKILFKTIRIIHELNIHQGKWWKTNKHAYNKNIKVQWIRLKINVHRCAPLVSKRLWTTVLICTRCKWNGKHRRHRSKTVQNCIYPSTKGVASTTASHQRRCSVWIHLVDFPPFCT